MEIPYTVTNRPDTGLYNAKVGIWLFLASEVMLFGGLFSSYVFLRIGADFPWPFHELKVFPGFVNTMVLILSSVTVVTAWAALKARKYGLYQINMIITLLCALGFMGIKSYEYYGKFHHYSIVMTDGTVIDGHPVEPDAATHGDHIPFVDVNSFTLDTDKSKLDFLKHRVIDGGEGKPYSTEGAGEVVKMKLADGSEVELTPAWLKDRKKAFHHALSGRSHIETSLARAQARVRNSEKAQTKNSSAPGPDSDDLADVEKYEEELRQFDKTNAALLAPTIALSLPEGAKPLRFLVSEKELHDYTDSMLHFKEGTVLNGKLAANTIEIKPDMIDLRMVKNPEKSLAWKYFPELKETILERSAEKMAAFKKKYPKRADTAETDPDATHEASRIEFEEFHEELIEEKKTELAEKFHGFHENPISVDRADKRFYSNFSPSRSPYYAIYFLMTGLHGLHVIGGAIVLGYFLLFGRKMYLTNPEHLANRVEVGGLFWHFVDLVWIFLFPLYYLM